MATSIGSLSLQLTADASQLLGTLGRAGKAIEKFASAPVRNIGKQVAEASGAFAGLFKLVTNPFAPIEAGLQSFFDLVGKGSKIREIQQTAKAADRLGVSTEFLITVARASGQEIDELVGGLFRAQAMLGKTSTAAEAVTTPLEKFGLDTEKLRGMGFEDYFDAVANRMTELASGADQAALAMAAFGRQGVRYLPALQKGAAGLAELKETLGRQGLLFSREDAQRAVDAAAAVKTLKGSFEGIKTQLALSFAPLITDIAKGLQGWIDKMGGGREIAKAIANTVLDIVIGFAKVGQGIERTIDDVRQLGIDLAKVGKTLVEIGAVTSKGAGGIGGLFGELVPDDWSETLGKIFSFKTESERMKDEFRKKVGYGPMGKDKRESGKGFFDNMIEGLEKAKEGVAGLGTGTGGTGFLKSMENLVKTLVEDQQQLAIQSNDLAKKIELEADAFGLAGHELEIFKLQQKGASAAMLEGARAAVTEIHALEDLKKLADDARNLFEQTRTPVEQFGQEIERINQLAEAGQIDWELWGRGVQAAGDKFLSSFGQGPGGPAALLQGSAGAISAINAEFNKTERANPFKRAEESLQRSEEIQRRILEELKKQAGESGLLPNLIA